MEPLCIENCTRVKVKGLTIDYKRKPFSSGEIISIQPDYFDVQFTDERIITDEMPLTRMTIWNKEKNRMYPDPIYFPKRELLGNNRVRFHHQIPAGLLGADAGVLHSFHFRPAILIHRSTQTELEGVTIHSQAGMGIVGFDSKDILIKRLAVVPAQGYYILRIRMLPILLVVRGYFVLKGALSKGREMMLRMCMVTIRVLFRHLPIRRNCW
ncbi:hypothetical protein DXA15_16080 [Parabacteroides sp. AM58-2XD]|nr:hypothetical protein DXA15_16080 [Parabacteroides sp. AM58-2XD]